jgi:hypothetical protein
MSQLNGKQIKNQSTSLGKLDGSGVVAFTSATMSFAQNSVLTRVSPTEWSNNDIVNKNYVDSVVQGLDIKESVKIKSDVSLVLSGTQTIQGVTLLEGNRVLANGQDGVNPNEDNGIWVVQSGAWTRPDDFKAGVTQDGLPIVTSGAFTFVEDGTFADSGFVLVTDGTITVDTTPIKFSQFSGAGQVTAGTGLDKSGNELFIDNTGVTASSYGSASSVATFTVNAQGQLTVAQDVVIDITSAQVNDFNTAVSNEVFETGNFVDSNSVDFTVTNGASVSADVIVNGDKGLAVSADGVEIKVDGVTIDFNLSGELEVVSSALAVQGAENGLTVSNFNVELGGDLTRDTSINGVGSFGLEFTGITSLTMSAANVDVTSNGDVNITSNGDGINLVVPTGDVNTTVTTGDVNTAVNSGDVNTDVTSGNVNTTVTTGDVNTSATNITMTASTSFDLSFNEGIVTSDDNQGLKYAADYSSTFVDESLITKRYVDDKFGSKAEPIYDSFELDGPITRGNIIEVSAVAIALSTGTASISEKSRFQAFVNGLQVSVGYSSGPQIANLPGHIAQAIEFDTAGSIFKWQSTNYDLEVGDVIEVFYEGTIA